MWHTTRSTDTAFLERAWDLPEADPQAPPSVHFPQTMPQAVSKGPNALMMLLLAPVGVPLAAIALAVTVLRASMKDL